MQGQQATRGCEGFCHGLLLQVGLGTDVAGGYSPSMLSSMRHAVTNWKAVRMLRTDRARRASAAEPQAASHAGGNSAAGRQCPPASSSSAGPELEDDRAAGSAPEQGTAGVSAVHQEGQLHGAFAAHAEQGSGQVRGQRRLPEGERLSIDGPEDMECLDFKGAFWLATMGGAEALGLQVRGTARAHARMHACLHGILWRSAAGTHATHAIRVVLCELCLAKHTKTHA